MSVRDVLNECEPETDPGRRGWQILLAGAWSLFPRAGVDEAVGWAVRMAGPLATVDRDQVEQVALEMLLARGEAAGR